MTQLRRFIILVGISLTFIGNSGCRNPFSPALGKITGQGAVTLTEQQTPDEVLDNMRYAYIYRDSLIYSQLFDTSFVFIYYDPEAGGGGAYNFWGLDTELRVTGRLFRAFDHFTLVWNATLYDEYRIGDAVLPDSIPQEQAIAQADRAALTKTFSLTIGTEIHLSGNAVFDFVKGSDNRWRISRWQDESVY